MAKTADHASRASEPRPATGAGQDSRKAMMARAIVEKACTLFSEKGYAGTSLTDIAEALGMTRGAMYYYFSNKEALLESIVEEALVVPLAEIAEWRETASGTAAERLRSFVVGRVRNTLNLQTQMRMLQVTELAMPADLFARYTEFKRKILEEYRALVREGMLNGEFLPVDDRLASLGIIGLVNWSIYWYSPDRNQPIDQIADQLAEMAVRTVLRETDRNARFNNARSALATIREDLDHLEKLIEQ